MLVQSALCDAKAAVTGGVAERLKAPVLKTGKGFASSWVRIPSPPLYETSFLRKGRFVYVGSSILGNFSIENFPFQ